MAGRILVAYATRCGSTAEVAEVIGQELQDDEFFVDVRRVDEVKDLSPYQAVVVGSPIRGQGWVPEALGFLFWFREQLHRMPVAYFLTCRRLAHDTTETRREATAYMDPVLDSLPEIEPVALGCFAGKMDLRTMNWALRVAMMLNREETGDWRNWDAIRTWAAAIRPALLEGLLCPTR